MNRLKAAINMAHYDEQRYQAPQNVKYTHCTINDREYQCRYTVVGDEIVKIEVLDESFSPTNQPAKWVDVGELFDMFVEGCADHLANIKEEE